MTERRETTGGFAVGDRVKPRLNDCYGKVTWVGGCSDRNTPWCTEFCRNIEMECLRADHHRDRSFYPADELEHID
jgi:hypothetical protein